MTPVCLLFSPHFAWPVCLPPHCAVCHNVLVSTGLSLSVLHDSGLRAFVSQLRKLMSVWSTKRASESRTTWPVVFADEAEGIQGNSTPYAGVRM